MEWDPLCGISDTKVFPLLDGLKDGFKTKEYGTSIAVISVVLTCMAKDLKQRKRFKKVEGRFEYDILLDYFLIKNVDVEQKKAIIRKQIIEISKQTFSTYKFEDFDKNAFLTDIKEITHSIDW